MDGTALEAYGSTQAVGHLVDRLMMLHSAAPDVGRPGMRAVASLAIMIGANPLPGAGEIHVWKDKGKIGVDLGIFFYRRRADELGGVFWVIKPRPMTDEERALYQIGDQELAAIASAVRKPELERYLELGFSKQEIFDGLAKVGIGTVHKGAQAKAGRPLIWTALKNCEKDLLRLLYSNWQRIPEGAHVPLILQPGATVDQDWEDIPEAVRQEGAEGIEAYARLAATTRAVQEKGAMSPDEALAVLARNSKALGQPEPGFEGFGDEPEPRIVEGSARIKAPKPGARVATVGGEGLADEIAQALAVAQDMQASNVGAIALQQIREASGLWANDQRDEGKAQPPDPQSIGRLASMIDHALKQHAPWPGATRAQVLTVLFGKESTKSLAAQEIKAALDRWQIHSSSYAPNGLAMLEIPSLLALMERPEGPPEGVPQDEGPQPLPGL